jgi:ferredoxin hydrogenase gamma subunit
MPCTAKKGEAGRPEFSSEYGRDVDAVLTTREFARLLKREGIDLPGLESTPFDNPIMGEYSGAAVIFGATGGLMEAALRTVHKVVTGEELDQLELKAVRGNEYLREAEIDLGHGVGKVRVAVVHTLKAARQMIEAVRAGESSYHFVEVMACPGGCASGGGQPRNKHSYLASRSRRQEGLYAIDRECLVRQSHNNPMIQKLYEDYLEKPLGHKSHHLLHTGYTDRKRIVRHTMKKIWQEIEERT